MKVHPDRRLHACGKVLAGVALSVVVAIMAAFLLSAFNRCSPDVQYSIELHQYQSGCVDGEQDFTAVYFTGDDSGAPLFDINLTNSSDDALSIEGVVVEVVGYKGPGEFSFEVVAGGADAAEYVYWECALGTEVGEYNASLSRFGQQEMDSQENYIVVAAGDELHGKVALAPSEEGLYTVRYKVVYQSNAREYEIASSEQQFVYLAI